MLRLSSKASRIGSVSRISAGKVAARPTPAALTSSHRAASASKVPTANAQRRAFSSTPRTRDPVAEPVVVPSASEPPPVKEHAVISAFDLFSIGVGPSSSHTVGPMRAAKIFVVDLEELGLLDKVETLKITLYGSLAATGKGHQTPEALMMGFQGNDPETIDTGTISSRYQSVLTNKLLMLSGTKKIKFDMDKDMVWRFDQVLKTHPNGMRFSVFGKEGELLATNEYFSVGGGFVVNEKTKTDENLYYMGIHKKDVDPSRLSQTHVISPEDAPKSKDAGIAQPPYLFHSSESLLAMTEKHNKTIAQLVYDNELHYLSPDQIRERIRKIWSVMDECIRNGVSTHETVLPGRMQVRRKAPMLYKRLMRGFYPGISAHGVAGQIEGAVAGQGPALGGDALTSKNPFSSTAGMMSSPRPRPAQIVGQFDHDVPPMPSRKTIFPGVDFLSCYAIAVNEVNAGGGRIVTSPTNGASGVIPAVLKYIVEFISEDPETDITTFLLTAAAIGMLFKRGATISAAEGGCMAEVGVACAMAAAGFAATMGASPRTITHAAEIGIEHSLGLTCDPLDGLVQVPCIERNSLGAVKAITAGQLAMASDGVFSVTLDEAIAAMKVTAADMSHKYKETSLSGLATSVRIPLTSPAC